MKKFKIISVTLLALFILILIFPMPHGGSLGGAFLESFKHEFFEKTDKKSSYTENAKKKNLESLSPELKIIFNDVVNTQTLISLAGGSSDFEVENYIEILKKVSRPERKKVCLKIIETYKRTNPELAYSGASCLLYNGYGESAIPFFTEFLLNGNSEKYLNGRMGYDWLHAGDWYEVGGEVFQEMTKGDELFTWVMNGIQKEMRQMVLGNSKNKLSKEKIEQILNLVFHYEIRNNPPDEDHTDLVGCENFIISIENYQCYLNYGQGRKLHDCKEGEVSTGNMITCNSNKSAICNIQRDPGDSCEGVFLGAEFNKKTNKCESVSWGCDDPPFKKIKDCKDVCEKVKK